MSDRRALVRASELGIALAHLSECALGALLKGVGDRAYAQLKLHRGGAGLAAQHPCRAQRRMSGEGKLFGDGEDAHRNRRIGGGAGAGKDEGRLRQAGLAGQRLHLGRRQAARIGEHGQLVALERARGEDIDLHVREAARGCHPVTVTLFVANCLAGSGRHAIARGTATSSGSSIATGFVYDEAHAEAHGVR